MHLHDKIIIKGARQHNLKNIDVEIPKNKLVVFTGLSGSGKSSLAFDTIYAEGQRRYVESLSSYARQFLGIMDKPDLDSIEGLSPAISIDQKAATHNPRSTVGTVTEIYDYLRLLFARIGHPHCVNCSREITRQSPGQIKDSFFNTVSNVIKTSKNQPQRIIIFSPVIRGRKGEFTNLFAQIRKQGYSYVRIDRNIYSLDEDLVLIKTNKHDIDVLIDRITITNDILKNEEETKKIKARMLQSVEQALRMSLGLVIFSRVLDASFTFPEKPQNMEDSLMSEHFACPLCNINIPEIEPRIFSFNSPHGACQKCNGIGTLLKIDPERSINKNLSLKEGALKFFARDIIMDTWFGRTIIKAAEDIGINPSQRLSKVPDDRINKLLYGTNGHIHEIRGMNRYGKEVTIYEDFQGIIKEMEKRLSESESEFVRREIEKYLIEEVCPLCQGKRLKKESLLITVDNKSIVEVTAESIEVALSWIKSLENIMSPRETSIATLIIKELINRLEFLNAVGLDYLTLDRSAGSLAGGEAQRIRLASQIGSGLSGVLYVLDEPSIGLHARDNGRLIKTLEKLRDLGNTVIVVEHDRETIEAADYILDFGPGAGSLGGKIVARGSLKEILANKDSVTAKYLKNTRLINIPSKYSQNNQKDFLSIGECTQHNLKNIDLKIPLGMLVCVTGVSGSGKSTAVVDTLYPALINEINGYYKGNMGKYSYITGADNIKRVILIDQSPIGRTPRSNPATYTNLFSYVREIFSRTPESKAKGYKPGRFSFNVKGGRCEACQGEGEIKIEMQFLPDVYVSCEVCRGTRFSEETLEIIYKGKNISDILNMSVKEALNFFTNIPQIRNRLETLADVGLGYIKLGQPATQLSGGEAQRIKLALQLAKSGTKNTLFILDEPTTGLHFADLEKLIYVLKALVAKGNTCLVIEHNLDIIKNCDYIIDLGPEGGDKGGMIIAEGTPQDIIKDKNSHTGRFLTKVL